MTDQLDIGLLLPQMPSSVSGAEICKLLNISRTTLWRLRGQGLPATKVRGQLRYRVDEVERWLKSEESRSPEESGKSVSLESTNSDRSGLPPCHWKPSVALDPKHRPQTPNKPSSTVRREWWRYPQEAHLLDPVGHRYRRLLASEIAVLQGFPSDWGRQSGLSDLDLIKGYGNAVPPPVAEAFIGELSKVLPKGIRTAVEICAGFGGIALGTHNALTAQGLSVEHLALVDFWQPAVEVLAHSGMWNPERVHCADVTTFDWSSYADTVDFLSGGPPCQPWSQGGKGFGARDDRDLLGFMPELLRTLRPKAFLFENVPGLLSGENATYAKWLIDQLRCEGMYGVAVGEFCAADFGVPQVRRRVFIVGIMGASDNDVHRFFDAVAARRTHSNPRAPLEGKQPWVTIGQALDGWGDVRTGWRRWIDLPSSSAKQDEDTVLERADMETNDHPTRLENDNAPSGIGLWWPGRKHRPVLVDGHWTIAEELDLSSVSTIPLLRDGTKSSPDTEPWYVKGDPVVSLDALRRTFGRRVDLVYCDAPRLRTDAAAFEAADGQAALNTWLTLMQAVLRRSVQLLSDDGVIVVLAGLVESPYVQILLSEMLGPSNYVGTIAWQKGYAPQNMPNMREFYYTHDNLVVFAKRREQCLPRVALRVPVDGFKNPDGDPRMQWKAEQKGANKPDCDYSVNIPPYRWKVIGQLPPGVWRINAKSGVIWGEKLTEAGCWTFDIEVSDRSGSSVRKKFSIEVTETANEPEPMPPRWLIADGTNGPSASGNLKISTKNLPTGRVGAPYYACLEAAGGEPWIGTTRPGKTSSSGTGRYWDYPSKTLLAAAADDRVDFKESDDAIPAIKTYLNGATESPLNQVTTWLGGAGADTSGAKVVKEKDPFKIGYGQDAKKELEALAQSGVIDKNKIITTSKPSGLICRLLALFSRDNGVVLDLGSPAAEMASLATAVGRKAVYVEFPGEDTIGEALRLPRLRLASKGMHPLPASVMFSGEQDSSQPARGFFIGANRRQANDDAGVCVFEHSKPFARISPSQGGVLIDYSTFGPKTTEFFEALASVEGLIPSAVCNDYSFASSWDGRIVAAYVASEAFLDESVIEQLSELHIEHLSKVGNRLRIYYHRGFPEALSQVGNQVELRRVPFDLQISVGAM